MKVNFRCWNGEGSIHPPQIFIFPYNCYDHQFLSFRKVYTNLVTTWKCVQYLWIDVFACTYLHHGHHVRMMLSIWTCHLFTNSVSGENLGHNWSKSRVSKSNWLHIVIFRFVFINVESNPKIPLKWSVIFMHSWTSTNYFSNSIGSSITTLNIPISEGGINSNHMHNLAKYQRAKVAIEWHT